MAESNPSSMLSEQELTCSICLDIFNDPVSTPCGHNFCQSCIGRYWATSSTWSCPLCKRQFSERPQLAVNRVFAHITSKCKETCYTEEGQDPATGVSSLVITCDVCTGRKLKAVSSCLTCTASYCDIHVQPHLQNPNYNHHKLLDPFDAFQGRTCPIHNRLLEVYCCTDQVCICAICVLEEHCNHRTVSVQTERARKQKFLGKIQFEIQRKTEEKSIKLTALTNKVESLRNFAQNEISQMENILMDLSRSVERIRGELVGGIMEKQAAMEARGEEYISHLEAEVGQLQEQQAILESQATSEDHIGFLQNFQKALEPLETDAEMQHDEDDVELPLHLENVKKALTELHHKLEDIHMTEVRSENQTSLSEAHSMMSLHGMRRKERSIKDLTRVRPGSGLKKIRAYTEDVMLNPVTAYPFLIVSDNGKQVKRGEKTKLNVSSPQRYDVWSCVLAKEGFTSGRHYWEVTVGDSKDWKLGVVRESAPRKGLFDMSPRIGYYAIWWSANQLRVLTSPLTKVKISSRLRRVGIYIDCEEGQVVFYNAKPGSVVYAFSGEEFSEKMLPLFGTGDKDVPLVLSTPETNIPE